MSKKCKFCKVKLLMKIGLIRNDRSYVDYYWCPECGLMYKCEVIDGFYLGDDE